MFIRYYAILKVKINFKFKKFVNIMFELREYLLIGNGKLKSTSDQPLHYGVRIGIPSKSLPSAELPQKLSSSIPFAIKCSSEHDFSLFEAPWPQKRSKM